MCFIEKYLELCDVYHTMVCGVWRFLVICLFLFLFMLGNPLLWKEMKTTYVLQVEGMRKTALLIYTVYLHPTTFTVIRVLRFWIGPLLTFLPRKLQPSLLILQICATLYKHTIMNIWMICKCLITNITAFISSIKP